jgi:dihydropyrimidinase
VIWNPERETTITAALLHDNVGYTPYEGRQIRGWPEVVTSRGRVVVSEGELKVARGSGRFIARQCPEPASIAQRPTRSHLPGLLGLKGKAWESQ